jgi:hypothetical protein
VFLLVELEVIVHPAAWRRQHQESLAHLLQAQLVRLAPRPPATAGNMLVQAVPVAPFNVRKTCMAVDAEQVVKGFHHCLLFLFLQAGTLANADCSNNPADMGIAMFPRINIRRASTAIDAITSA